MSQKKNCKKRNTIIFQKIEFDKIQKKKRKKCFEKNIAPYKVKRSEIILANIQIKHT